MNFRRLLYVAALIVAASACKKDEETEISPSLEGVLTIHNLPEFVLPGEKVILTASGVEHPEGKALTYHWKVSPSMTEYKEADIFQHVFSDTLRTYTITCYVAAEGYANSSTSMYTTLVAPGEDGSIQGVIYSDEAEGSVSVEGGQPYYYKTIGNRVWMLNNLAAGEGLAFRQAEVMADIFGRYYNYEQAKAACNALDTDEYNWELPSLEDWADFETYLGNKPAAKMMGDVTFNGLQMWEYFPTVGDITNDSDFSAIPLGYANTVSKTFYGLYEYATFWTANEVSADEAYYKYIICDQAEIQTGKGSKTSFGASVRCVRK